MHLKVSRLPDPLHAADDHDAEHDEEGDSSGVGNTWHQTKQSRSRGEQPGVT